MKYHFRLDLSSDEYLRFYKSQARHVLVQSNEGLTIRFPAEHLRTFVDHEGVHGIFELESTSDGKFVSLVKLAD
jgi:uncharacterized protein YqjF (DUF2071 family)